MNTGLSYHAAHHAGAWPWAAAPAWRLSPFFGEAQRVYLFSSLKGTWRLFQVEFEDVVNLISRHESRIDAVFDTRLMAPL
ncbi:MAG: hypothetical protein ABGZ35_20245 [Planctomycetaceae bacterium]